MPVTLHLYVDDIDAWWTHALAAGCEVVQPLADQFWGDRYGVLRCAQGHQCALSSHVEDVSEDELRARQAQAFGGR